MSTEPDLTIVLPAYNEAERIGPALDELFGYLSRRGAVAREGAPGAGRLPDPIEVLVVDDGSTDATAEIVEAPTGGRESMAPVRRGCGSSGCRTAAREPRSAPACWTRRRIAHRVRRRRHGDAAGPAAAARRGAGGSRSSRWGPGSSPTGRTCARRSLATGAPSGKVFHALASIWVVGPVKDTQCGFKGFTQAAAHDLFARQQVTSIVFDVELIYLARRRGYRIAIVPDPLVGPARIADARAARARDPGRLGPLPDSADPSAVEGPRRRAAS